MLYLVISSEVEFPDFFLRISGMEAGRLIGINTADIERWRGIDHYREGTFDWRFLRPSTLLIDNTPVCGSVV